MQYAGLVPVFICVMVPTHTSSVKYAPYTHPNLYIRHPDTLVLSIHLVLVMSDVNPNQQLLWWNIIPNYVLRSLVDNALHTHTLIRHKYSNSCSPNKAK